MEANKRKRLEDAGLLYPSVVTNADRIRQMSDEELCVFLAGIYTLVTDFYGDYDPCVVIDDHKFCDPNDVMGWLESPVEG
jgi:hypothetical protein